MGQTHVCELCGTVNLLIAVRCIACGDSIAGQRAAADGGDPAADDLDSAAQRATVLEEVPHTLARLAAADDEETAASAAALLDGTVSATSEADIEVRFAARLLLPDGDRRAVEIGSRRLSLGSGLDDLGVTGDPRVGEKEGHLHVLGADLVVEPCDGAEGVYRRVRDEETLESGDVVLMGDVAALFATVAPGPPVDGSRHVLGGSANTPCGRLTFLRRDGSPGPVHDLPAGKTIVGRTDGHLNFPQDARLSRRHARFFASDKGVTVEDLGSRNGTYLRVRGRQELHAGDALRIGSAGLQIRGKA